MWFWDSSESDQGIMDDKSVFDDCFQLSRTQRLYAFGICFVVGFVISIVSSLALIQGNITGFAVLYTLGNIVSLVSTGFLVGFKKQVKTMFAPVRWFASVLFLVSMAATLFFAIVLKIFFLCLIMCVIQWCALLWYCASYIPYGRTIIKKTCGSCVGSMV